MRTLGVLAALGLLLAPGCLGSSLSTTAQSTCKPCVANLDCFNELCTQLAEDSVCARACTTDADCAATDMCVSLTGAEGGSARSCVARDGQCGTLPEQGGETADAGPADPACAKYQLPEVANTCCRCSPGRTCAANNCYGGWVCDASACRCTPLPATCGEAPSAKVDALRVGGPVNANVDAKGGTMDRLHFAVVGDTRPAVLNDTANYPVDVVRAIYSGIQGASPRPAFVVATGDYVFASPASNQTGPQLDKYLAARGAFTGPLFPAHGNHECNGFTASNCGPGTAQGETSNFRSFVQKMLGPLGEPRVYFKRRINATDGSWSAKFVVVSANAWTGEQAAWLEETLREETTYTFIVRHVPATMGGEASTPAPGVAPSEAIIRRYPFTLALEGHAHAWIYKRAEKEVIIGNGGAPMTTQTPFGYTVFSQRSADKAIVATSYDVATQRPLFTFAVNPDGTPAP
jgi:hypothetical protein